MNAPAKTPPPIALFPIPVDEFVEAVASRVAELLADGTGSGAVALLDRRGLAGQC